MSTSSKLDRLRPKLPRICVALSGPAMLTRAAELAAEHTFFELRLDTAPNPAAILPQLAHLLQNRPQVILIATCRRTANGGHFPGTPEDELHLLSEAAAAGAHLIDLSLETAEALTEHNRAALDALRNSTAALLLSWHDFHATPNLEAVHDRMRPHAPDLYKIVPTATTLRDSFALPDLLEAHSAEQNVVAMAMGQPGILTRILGPRFGSVFTFAASDAASATAPGQIDLRTLRDLYRIENISADTELYGVFGNPISGSHSPVMLNTAFRETGTDAVYLPLETGSADELFETFHRLHLAGASVTMPLKEQVLPRIDRLHPLAAKLGAANTLSRDPGITIAGGNTDAAGIADPLAGCIVLNGATILVLGAGGAARAAVFALRDRGATVAVLNRTFERAQHLAQQAGVTALPRQYLAHCRFDVIVNATPYGMANRSIEAPINASELSCCKLFFDLVYNPLETPLIVLAKSQGIPVLYGIEMFLAQGAAQFELWTGKPAPREAMRQAVLEALQLSS